MQRARATRTVDSRGFTLMEVALAIVIVGVAMVALLEVLASGSRTNAHSQATITGGTMVSAVREMTVRMNADQMRALDGTVYSPPVDAAGTEMTGFDNWSQRIKVDPVNVNQLSQKVSQSPSVVAYRVTVTAVHNDEAVCRLQWVVMDE